MSKVWNGTIPTTCNICQNRFGENQSLIFVDGKTIVGIWAIMCTDCHAKYGTGLGIGKGQSYWFDTLNKVVQ